jgi:long-chain-fatty-acid--[acyl-carrier-protein] ligase
MIVTSTTIAEKPAKVFDVPGKTRRIDVSAAAREPYTGKGNSAPLELHARLGHDENRMMQLLRSAFLFLLRLLFGFRYRVRVEGLEEVRNLEGPLLILPNHPGYVDPPLLMSHLRIKQTIRPTVFSGIYRTPVFYPLMRLLHALEVPDLSEHSHEARGQTLSVIDSIVSGVQQGESFLIYPSGRVQRREQERIGSARAAAETIQRCPQAKIVLVRTRGIWGSMFSYARTGRRPHLGWAAVRALGWVLANLAVFIPRRDVTITLQVIDRSELPGLSREELNPFLDQWYFPERVENAKFVPYHFCFGPRNYHFPHMDAAGQVDLAKIKPATIHAVNDLIEEHVGHALEDDEKQANVPLDQLGLDSLDRMDVALKIENRFGFHSDRVGDSLGELWALAEGLVTGSGEGPRPAPAAWIRTPHTIRLGEILAETIAEAFVRRALANPRDIAVADQVSGALCYRKLLVGASLLGKRFDALQGHAVGILLPASVAADLVYFSLQLVGKLPVILNWTTGPANVAHAVEILDVRYVVTSRKLIDRLGIEVSGAEYVFLEDVKAGIGKLEALATLVRTYLLPGRFLQELPRPNPDEPAVVLFTSGSESTPKAVPLSHGNLITNARDALAVVAPKSTDAMLGFLPPFHSFGLLGNIIATVLGGIRVVHHPDPTDAGSLVHLTATYGATFLVTTPTFLGYMLAQAKPENLRTLRLIITGAEKCPDALFDKALQMVPQLKILEGYGITECSPIVSGNRPDRIKRGTVGQPMDQLEICVVDPNTHQPLPPNTTGMLLVHGPSVFHGYLNYSGPAPFLELDGRRWYVTGDLVQVDEQKYISFRGRLKRFLKAGGEMISLPALEEPFNQLYPPTDQGPQVAVEGVETRGGRLIVLFSVPEITLRQANAILAKTGFRGVMRIDDVMPVDSIPVLGTGKTDYKVLRRMVADKAQAALK